MTLLHQDTICWKFDDKGKHGVVQDAGGRLPVAEHCSLPPPLQVSHVL